MKHPDSKIIHTILAERELRYAQKFESLEKANVLALSNAKEQTATALASNEKRLDGMNEFRQQQRDMIDTLMPRGEADARFKAMEDKLNIVIAAQNTGKGKFEGANWLWGVIIGLVGLGIAFISMRH